MKKTIFAAIFGLLAISFGGCKPMDKELNAIKGKDGVFAIMETSKGSIVLELFYKQTPLTVTNFVGLAEGTLDATKGKHFYDGLTFHRVIADFMIQGGDPEGSGRGGPGYRFADEFDPSLNFDKPGYLAMANAGPGTNGSQFFITHVPTEWLNQKHTIFGQVVNEDSQKVVNAVQQGDKIEKITIIRQGDEAKKFTATQADFDKHASEAKAKAAERAKAAAAAKIKEVEEKFPGFNKDPNGIYYKTTKDGSGEKIGGKRAVAVEYKGYFVNGQVFDQSKGRGPLEFTTAGGQMIPGFDVMVQDMKLGEKRTIVLPPSQAYGENGIPGVIPGGAYLAFDIELTKVKK
ncbi:peptidylprolyl isomerase [uncultured Treponema sp.]|uniref:peptidylprolyl isomerase n=1 Tax=uncultured Treponema sp. TaxID=162155 RepID=UPI0025D1FAFB|nr:peptidylprolyl isomerase [uncultured Treponema sp.]